MSSLLCLFLLTLITPLHAADPLLTQLRKQGNLSLSITDERGKTPERVLFQSNKKQKMISSAACLAASTSTKKVCRQDGTVLLRVTALRLIRQKNDQVRVTLKSNLGTFRAEPLVSPKALFSSQSIQLKFPKTHRKWAGAFDLSAAGDMTLKRSSKGLLILTLHGVLGVRAQLLGIAQEEKDEAKLKGLIAQP